jgi:large subunit ribosomal protein L41
MKPSSILQLLRPWKPYKDGTLFYGLRKTGNKRWPLTTKQGNKNFYKGTRSSGIGRFTSRGRYLINWEKVRTYVVPSNVHTTDLKPFVCSTAPKIVNSYKGYKEGAIDGNLYLDKVKEFIEYGTVESPAAQRSGHRERG